MKKDVLRESEAQKYAETWKEPSYRLRCHGLELWLGHSYLFPNKMANAIDFGSGTGRLVAAWVRSGIDGHGIDIAANAADAMIRDRIQIGCLWDFKTPVRYDAGVCADVMEHIPPEKVEAVLACISKACKVCVFKIANYPSMYEGRNLHLSLYPKEWWLATLQKFGETVFIDEQNGVEDYIFQVTFH